MALSWGQYGVDYYRRCIDGAGPDDPGKAGDKANKQAYDTIVPEIVGNIFTNIQMDPLPHLLDAKIRIFRCPVIVTAVAADTSGEHIMD